MLTIIFLSIIYSMHFSTMKFFKGKYQAALWPPRFPDPAPKDLLF